LSRYADQQQVTNVKTGKVERVFVNLEAVYPSENDPYDEMSFEELRANSRGWLSRDWAAESRQRMASTVNIRDGRVPSDKSNGPARRGGKYFAIAARYSAWDRYAGQPRYDT